MLNQLKEEIDEGTEVWYEFKEVKDEIQKIEEKEFEIWKMKNRLAEEENAEQVNLAMKIKAKKKRENNRIMGLINKQGDVVENEEEIQKIVEDFYKQIYTLPDQEQDSRMDSLADFEPVRKVKTEENELILQEVTWLETEKIIRGMKNGKSPGVDGLGYEFYKELFPEIGDLFTLVVTRYVEQGYPEDDVGMISLLFKGGDRMDLQNWRPISVSNSDYRITSKF